MSSVPPSRIMRSLYLMVLVLVQQCQAHELLQPFPLSAVRLAPNSEFDKAQSLNAEYMLSLSEDDLLRTFRENAKLPAPGKPFSGSWEDSGCEVRGQFMGHYLSALAFLSNHTGVQTGCCSSCPCFKHKSGQQGQMSMRRQRALC